MYGIQSLYVNRSVYQESLALLDVGDSVPNKEAMEALMKVEKQVIKEAFSLNVALLVSVPKPMSHFLWEVLV
ncbi:hypothetical protein L6452_14744 [Arctium lappa]|uniref:Uncharacterized protein n=1 Tax=Arctium lappa TaxID=4217 RepID=A0ACB9CMD3_ARCLA|nr:hypothetical protein L6452_14744 [Arctium lappa]